jgi:hypothetical protein
MSSDQESITRLLQEWSDGNKTALETAFDEVLYIGPRADSNILAMQQFWGIGIGS